jgi:hypothetical protein
MKRLLLFAALIAWSGMAGAVVYKWIDAQGKLQYGDRPPDGVHAEVVEFLGAHPGRTTLPRALGILRAAGARAPAQAPTESNRGSREEGRGRRCGADPRKAVRGCAGSLQENDRGPAPITRPAPMASASI